LGYGGGIAVSGRALDVSGIVDDPALRDTYKLTLSIWKMTLR
jgi:hypothetical protein